MGRTPRIIAQRLWPDARIERSIFGSEDPEEIWRHVREACPEAEDCFAFEVSIGALLGVVLADGSRVALKVHRRHSPERLAAVQRVQAHLHEHGFPSPRPLGVRGRVTLEEWVDDGDYRDAHEPSVRRVVAFFLARLHDLTPPLLPLEGMAHWSHRRDPLWPAPHNVLFDFQATAAGAEWIDEVARRAKPVRDAEVGRLVVGHGDWTVKHFRFDGLRPTVIYDWDSLNVDHETVFVGGSAATFTYTEQLEVEVVPTVDEVLAYVADYERARREPFTREERRAALAAATYSRAYGTRCGHAVGVTDRAASRLDEYAEAFL